MLSFREYLMPANRRPARPLRVPAVALTVGLVLMLVATALPPIVRADQSRIQSIAMSASKNGGPDVVVENILITDVPTGGGNSLLNIVETFKNNGGGPSPAVKVQETLNGKSVGSFDLPPLDPGKTHTRVAMAKAKRGDIVWAVSWKASGPLKGGGSSADHVVN